MFLLYVRCQFLGPAHARLLYSCCPISFGFWSDSMQTFSGTVGPVQQVSTCKVCHDEAPLYRGTDFNKTCEGHRARYLPLTGVAVYYPRCSQCALVFTNSFDHWSKSDYLKHIYND